MFLVSASVFEEVEHPNNRRTKPGYEIRTYTGSPRPRSHMAQTNTAQMACWPLGFPSPPRPLTPHELPISDFPQSLALATGRGDGARSSARRCEDAAVAAMARGAVRGSSDAWLQREAAAQASRASGCSARLRCASSGGGASRPCRQRARRVTEAAQSSGHGLAAAFASRKSAGTGPSPAISVGSV